ncbi:response regulator [Caldimonas sp. KR1-144]|uniref:response regulator n=1 Tax=Caldimonas sp. KR1-144 TaxID=3400911 RepID=UPI003C08BB94
MSDAIKVMVVDDHTLFRRGLTALLVSDGRFEVVAEAGDAAKAQQLAAQLRPQVMLLDNHLPGARGVDALPDLLRAAPGMRILMLTMSEDERDLADAMRAGASGYLLKTSDSDELGDAIERAARGQSSVSAAMTAKLAAAFQFTAAASAQAEPAVPAHAIDSLSAREREILELIAAGRSNKEIARELAIAETTVKIHVQHILRKLQLSSRVQAAVVAATYRASA